MRKEEYRKYCTINKTAGNYSSGQKLSQICVHCIYNGQEVAMVTLVWFLFSHQKHNTVNMMHEPDTVRGEQQKH